MRTIEISDAVYRGVEELSDGAGVRRFVERALQREIDFSAVRAVQDGNAGLDQDALMRLVDDEVAAVRAERRAAKDASTCGS